MNLFILQDQTLIKLTQTGMKSQKSQKDSEEPTVEEDPILVLHPNYIVADRT